MDFLAEQWMAIVVSAALVWVASAIMHTVLPHHKPEWKGMPDEEKVTGAMEGLAPGQYMFPWGTMADMKDPQFIAKLNKGPRGTLNVWASPISMGRNLGLMLVFYLVVGVFVAYVGSHTIAESADYMATFRITGAMAFMAYGLGWIPNMVWFGVKGFWAYTLDSLVYALLTAGAFGWLWQTAA